MVWDDNIKVLKPEHYDRTFTNVYNVLKTHTIRLLDTIENREYNWKKGHPYIKLSHILGSPVICSLTYQNKDVLYKDAIVTSQGLHRCVGDWKVLGEDDLLNVYKVLYGLVVNGLV